jgi:hypothetical protein
MTTIHIPEREESAKLPPHGEAQLKSHHCPECSIVFERVDNVRYPVYMSTPRIISYKDSRRSPMWNKRNVETLSTSAQRGCHLCSMPLAHFSHEELECLSPTFGCP